MDVREVNILVLAYLGDTIYEDYIRKYLISLGINHVDELQKKSTNYVSARAQSRIIKQLISEKKLTEEELSIFKRARNYKTTSHPKNCDIVSYKYATGLEAVIGYLEFIGNHSRIEKIMDSILGGNLC